MKYYEQYINWKYIILPQTRSSLWDFNLSIVNFTLMLRSWCALGAFKPFSLLWSQPKTYTNVLNKKGTITGNKQAGQQNSNWRLITDERGRLDAMRFRDWKLDTSYFTTRLFFTLFACEVSHHVISLLHFSFYAERVWHSRVTVIYQFAPL